MIDLPLAGWVPIRLFWQAAEPLVEWGYLGSERFTDPFFDATIQRALEKPFASLFRHHTSIGALDAWRKKSPGLEPSGLIFHMSRCGSTVVSQLLATLEGSLVVSEAGPIDAMARAHLRAPGVPVAQRIAWLQWIVSALGQPRSGIENRYFIKFDARTTFDLALVRQAFPNVPWVFVYRDPLEVMVSLTERPSAMVTPGMGTNLLPVPDLSGMTMTEYAARVLGLLCDTAIANFPGGRGMLVNYQQLPEMVWSELPAHFGFEMPAGAVEIMREAAGFDAKRRDHRFASDSERRRAQASDDVRRLAAEWIAPQYAQLEKLRRGA